MRALHLLIGLALWLGATFALAAEAKLGGKAPYFFISTYNPDLSGLKKVFLDQMVGDKAKDPKKVLLISFFNIDCKPCKKELPFLQKLFERYQDRGLGLIAVNCDSLKEKIDQVQKFVADARLTYPVLADRFLALQRRYGVESFPTMFVVSGDGVIQDIRVGYNEEKMPFPLADIQQKLGVPVEPLPESKTP